MARIATPYRHVLPAAAAMLILAAGIGDAAPAVVRHDLAVTLHLPDGRLSATDTLAIDPAGAAEVPLFLSRNARVASVTAAGKAVPHRFVDRTLTIPVPEGAREGEWEATVAYEAVFRDAVPDNPVNFEDPGFGVSGTISPKGVFLDAEARWYPAPAGGRSTFHLKIEADEGVEAVTAGALLRRTT